MAQKRFEREYQKLSWNRWPYPAGHLASLKKGSPAIPCRHGVYMIRAPKPLPRVLGSSNVVYIGQAGGGVRAGKQGIGPGNGGPGRLFNTRGPDESVRERIEAMFAGQEFSLECAFVDREDPEVIEERLLRAYLDDHCELPPANHSKRRFSQAL